MNNEEIIQAYMKAHNVGRQEAKMMTFHLRVATPMGARVYRGTGDDHDPGDEDRS